MPFTYRPETAGVSTLCRKIFFKFGNRQVYGLGNGLMACPFHATDLPGRESLKNMKPESPFLNLGQSAHCKKLLQGFPGILAVLYVNNSFFPFFIQSASGTMLRFLQTVDRNILAGLGVLCPILLIVNLIGQGFQLATPLQVAVVMSEIANGGHRYKPYLVSKVTGSRGEVLQTFAPEETGKLEISAKTLQLIRESLRDVAMDGGTAATAFRDFPVSIAGKTGTAENSHGSDHGWFVAYAPYDNPRIVVAVLVEQGGFGAGSAVPIARKIFEAAFNLNQPTVEGAKLYSRHAFL